MKLLFKKSIILALIATLALASLPLVGVSALGANDPTPPPQGQITNDRWERVWARQLRIYNRLGEADQLIERIQTLIDRANANGKDVSAVQSAHDAFAAAWKNAKPTYEGMNGIVSSHQGFDDAGKVTDQTKALGTIQAMRAKFLEIRTAMNGTGKALHEAIEAFREANPRPWHNTTPTPSNG